MHIYGKEVNQLSCSILEAISTKLEPSSLKTLLHVIDNCKICAGHPESEFVSILESRSGCIVSASGEHSAYIDKSMPVINADGVTLYTTVRSSHCEIITNRLRCTPCVDYRNNLRAIQAKTKKLTCPDSRVGTESRVNYRYLHSPEKIKRLQNLKKENKTLSRKVAQLRAQLEKSTECNGVTLEKTLNEDMHSIINSNEIPHAPGTFARIFWDQQKESLYKNPKQMRWHPMMLKWCIHLRMLSSSCYRSFRSSGVLNLPSERTLRDYTNVIQAKSGLQKDVDEQLMKEAKLDSAAPHQKLVALLFDEVKIKEDLVYNKITGEIIGFVNVTDINQHLSRFEKSINNNIPKLATHMLVFMVRGICSKLEFPYAQFPVTAASGEILCPIVWECVEHLEMIGLKVLSFVCDGASSNRKFFKMLREGKDDGITYKIKNVYAEDDRSIFLISDVPHLLKTTRNSWANSHAHSNSRSLRVCIYSVLS